MMSLLIEGQCVAKELKKDYKVNGRDARGNLDLEEKGTSSWRIRLGWVGGGFDLKLQEGDKLADSFAVGKTYTCEVEAIVSQDGRSIRPGKLGQVKSK